LSFPIRKTSCSRGHFHDYYSRNHKKKSEVGRFYGKARFAADLSTNSVAVTTSSKENFPIIEEFIRNLDRPSLDAGSTMVKTLTNTTAKDVADQPNALFAQQGARAPRGQQGQDQRAPSHTWLFGAQRRKPEERPISNLIGEVRVVADARTNSLLVTTAVQNFQTRSTLTDQLDVPTPKVFASVRLIEISRTPISRRGTRWRSLTRLFDNEDFDDGLYWQFGLDRHKVYADGRLGATAGFNLNLPIRFLERNFDGRVVGKPSLTMNNHESKLFVGGEIPFITSSPISPGGARTDSFDCKNAGTTLNLTPHINNEGNVVMTVNIEASQVRPGETLFDGFILDTRTFDTEVAVDSGQTLVLGGILRQNDYETVRRVPVLGQIPIIDGLFKKTDKGTETVELIAFITPIVLMTAEDDRALLSAAGKKYGMKDGRLIPGLLDDQPDDRGYIQPR
jgi:general secretion pathway protein D